MIQALLGRSRRAAAAAFVLLAIALPALPAARADNFNAIANLGTGATFLLNAQSMSTATITIPSSYSGLSFVFQGSNDNGAHLTTLAACTPNNAPSTGALSSAGSYIVAVAGWAQLYIDVTALSGSGTVVAQDSPGAAGFACGL